MKRRSRRLPGLLQKTIKIKINQRGEKSYEENLEYHPDYRDAADGCFERMLFLKQQRGTRAGVFCGSRFFCGTRPASSAAPVKLTPTTGFRIPTARSLKKRRQTGSSAMPTPFTFLRRRLPRRFLQRNGCRVCVVP
jgi:hypothetical protein